MYLSSAIPQKNNEENIATIDNPVVEPEVEPELAPEDELEAPFTEEGIVTLDCINTQMKINHDAIMEKLESIQKRQKNEAESEAI